MNDSANTVGYLMQHLSTTLARQSEQLLQERLGLGFSQFKILMALQWISNVQQKQIADTLGQTEASISRQIKIMHQAGLVETKIKPSNRREHLTAVSRKGMRLTEEALNILNSYHSSMFELLSEKQRQQLLETLVIMHNHTCQPSKRGACHKMIN